MASTIVVGYIPTPQGEAAFQRAAEEAKVHKARLIVVNSSKRDAYIDVKYADDERWKDLEEHLKGIDHIMVQPEAGHDAADLLLDSCREYQADLVVIGLPKRSKVGKLLLGSTAQRVLMQAECDILSVRA